MSTCSVNMAGFSKFSPEVEPELPRPPNSIIPKKGNLHFAGASWHRKDHKFGLRYVIANYFLKLSL